MVIRSRFNGVGLAPALLLLLWGCGSSPSGPAESPADEAPASEGEVSAPEEEAAAEPEPSGPTFSRSVEEILSEPGNAWVLNFQSSEPYEKAEKECDGRFKDKPKERANCLSRARGSFTADVLEFRENQWVIYRNPGNRLIQIYSVPIGYGDEKDGKLLVKKTGSGKGSAPLFASAGSFEVKLLSNYSLELNDARYGRLTYDARLGFISK